MTLGMSSRPSDSITFEVHDTATLSPEMWQNAATLFSNHYGIWSRTTLIHAGERIRMSVEKIQEQLSGSSIYIGAVYRDRLVGHVFASRWDQICWITQLVVDKDFRRQGIATKMISKLREDGVGFGILSSHPAALKATMRAAGRDEVDWEFIELHAEEVMRASPVGYVRNAKLHGALFEKEVSDQSVSCADTDFWVDHDEPNAALEELREWWPFGRLPESHEFLLITR